MGHSAARSLPRSRSILVASLAALFALLPSTGAQAAVEIQCGASALSVSVLGQNAVQPVTAGGTGECATQKGVPTVTVPDLLSASALIAETNRGTDAANPSAYALSGLTSAKVSLLPNTLPQVTQTVDTAVNEAIAAVPNLTVPLDLTLLDPLGLLGLPSSLTIDLHDALAELAPSRFQGELVAADALHSAASATCTDGRLTTTADSVIANLRVLGQPVAANAPLTRDVGLLNSTSIDPSNVDLADLDVVNLTMTDALWTLLGPTIDAALDTLPDVAIPQQVLVLQVTPRQRLAAGNALAVRALRVEASLLGQRLLDIGVGDASIAASGSCPRADGGQLGDGGDQTADQEILACTDRKLHLVDVYEGRGRVRLRGVAHTRYAGRRITIRSAWDRRIVARPRVRRNGSFKASAPLPPARLRHTNRARYRAQAGRERSLNLKLHRRMRVADVDASRRTAVIKGRVSRPLTRPTAVIEMRRQVDCRKGSARYKLVKRFRPRPDGTFSVRVRRPGKADSAVYRFTTRVLSSDGGGRVVETYTLPVGVDFR